MKDHYSLDDEEFITQFRSCTFPPDFFTHEAHIRLAWIYLETYQTEAAIEHVCEDLFRFVLHLGATDKYHSTLTVASVKVIAYFKQKTEVRTFKEFIAEYPQLFSNFKEILHTYYSAALLSSEPAKNSFVEPDLLPFT